MGFGVLFASAEGGVHSLSHYDSGQGANPYPLRYAGKHQPITILCTVSTIHLLRLVFTVVRVVLPIIYLITTCQSLERKRYGVITC
jgi:hypothetical protein